MLASPVESPEEAVGRFLRANATTRQALEDPERTIEAFLEDKYDGMRAQLHCGDAGHPGRVAIYSRNREDVTESFPSWKRLSRKYVPSRMGALDFRWRDSRLGLRAFPRTALRCSRSTNRPQARLERMAPAGSGHLHGVRSDVRGRRTAAGVAVARAAQPAGNRRREPRRARQSQLSPSTSVPARLRLCYSPPSRANASSD